MSNFSCLVVSKPGDNFVDDLKPYDCTIRFDEYVIGETTASVYKTIKNIVNMYYEYPQMLDWVKKEFGNVNIEDKNAVIERFKQVNESDILDEQGNVLTYQNPKGRYCKWEVGGLFDGVLPIEDIHKSDADKLAMDLEKYALNTRGNVARVKWCNFMQRSDKKLREAARFWEINVEETPLFQNEAPEDYFTFFNKDYYLVKYTNKPTYINQQCKFNVYSMLIHGTWIEPDEEIWFESTKNIQAYWQDWFRKKDEILKSLNPDDICVMLDCVA